jgi:hypothetical protein
MIIEINNVVAESIKRDIKPEKILLHTERLTPEFIEDFLGRDHVIANTHLMGEAYEAFALPIKVAEVEGASSFVVTDNEGDSEVGAERCDTLAEAVNAMVNGVEGKTEVTFYCELCVDRADGTAIEPVARWCHTSRYDDGKQWN